MRSSFLCPETREEFIEADAPFLNGDAIDCPWCEDTHAISGTFSGTVVNRAAIWWAGRKGFRFYRSDRGAIEFVATPAVGRDHWRDGDDVTLAYCVGECIFWPSVAASRDQETLRHERCHVNQSRRHGHKTFVVKAWIERVLTDYQHDKFEISARRAERRGARGAKS